MVLGPGNPYNGMVIPGIQHFPSSAQGRVLADGNPICDGASCNSLFDPSLSKSYITPTNDFQPRLGLLISSIEDRVRAGAASS